MNELDRLRARIADKNSLLKRLTEALTDCRELALRLRDQRDEARVAVKGYEDFTPDEVIPEHLKAVEDKTYPVQGGILIGLMFGLLIGKALA